MSNIEIIYYTIEYNKLLRIACEKGYMTENDKTHLDHTNKFLRNWIDDYIVKLIN